MSLSDAARYRLAARSAGWRDGRSRFVCRSAHPSGELLGSASPKASVLIAIGVLVGAGLVATRLPSRNASRVDPLVAIRVE